ncbi:MAG: penicillin-binding protein 2 [Actinomycetota bacterium]|nr:penicillin-binding protein 2 [Actinomycetota bacterium]
MASSTTERGGRGAGSALRLRRTQFRLRIFLLLIAVVMSLFAARLFQLQGVDANAYASMAQAEGTRSVTLHAARGQILDRDGAELASSVDAVAITADPSLTSDTATRIAAVLSEELGLDYFAMVEKLRTPDTRFVYLARRVPTWRAEQAYDRLAAEGLSGVLSERDPLRTYPETDVAANLVGIVNAEGEGGSGLELAFNDVLQGTDGEATYVTAPSGEYIPMADKTVTDSQDGTTLVTTIDRDLQWYADRRLAAQVRASGAEWGVAITVDARTGEIYQFSQVPSFDPNRLSDLDLDRVRNRGLQDVYEPGSVQKVLTFAALLDAGLVSPTTRLVVPGGIEKDGYEINDYDDRTQRARMTATGALALSSNTGTIVAAEEMADERLAAYLRSFGLGQPTGVGLPGESAGILAEPETWSDAQRATVTFGQGLSVTALQMTAAVASIANDGEYVAPHLVSGMRHEDGTFEAAPAPERHRAVSEQAARDVASMMTAVTERGGTGPQGAIPGYLVAGKTGTSQRADPDGGYYDSGATVSYAGFAPADDPRFVTYVVIDNPQDGSGGGTGAGPVFHDIMSTVLQRYSIPPTGARYERVPLSW